MDAILSVGSEQQAEILALTMNYSTQLQSYNLQLQSAAEENLKLHGGVDNKDLLAPTDKYSKIENPTSTTGGSEETINDIYNV